MTHEAQRHDCDVLIVGAGPAGLALATELTGRGHTVRVVEKNARVGVQPRAKTTNVRTMTQMRRWGLAPEVRSRSPLSADFPRRVAFSTGLFGHEIHAFENAFCATPKRDDRFPENAEFIPQYVVEGILLDHVQSQSLAQVEFGARLASFEQDAHGVTASVAGADGTRQAIRARYLVGADGGRSTVREALGIAMQGQRNLVSFITLILRIPGLEADPGLKGALFHWVVNPDAPCIIGPMDRNDTWFWAMAIPIGAPTDDATLLGHVRAAIQKDFPLEILARDEWTVHRLIADRYRDGRVFLAGDACHLHSPFGGHGMNLGIGDAVDLGWKLAARLEGWGSDALLDSYEHERKPVHEKVLETSTENVAALSDHFSGPNLADAGPEGEAARRSAAAAVERIKRPEFVSLGVVLGYRYEGSPVVAEEAGAAPPFSVTDYLPTARPGALALHAWLADGRSIYDAFGAGFTLLRLAGHDAALERSLAAEAAAAGLPLTVADLSDEGLGDLYGAAYALVRPDQHVAWRGDQIPDPRELIDRVRGAVAINKTRLSA
ncbi:FAD-dependent monooxygenase [Amorphus sp. MBR-141]